MLTHFEPRPSKSANVSLPNNFNNQTLNIGNMPRWEKNDSINFLISVVIFFKV
jgi:hypothetical protein